MGDILPPKRQTVVDRLRRRIELYRRHQGSCLPRYDQASNGLYENHRQDTLLLKQRFLEAKAKKSRRGNAKDNSICLSDSQRNSIVPKLNKRPADSPLLDCGVDGIRDDQKRQPKIPCNSHTAGSSHDHHQGQQHQHQGQQTNIPSFSVQIVQQFTSSNASEVQHSQTIQTNVTVKALTSNIKSSDSPLASSSISTSASPAGGQSDAGASISVGTNIQCKQERDHDFSQCCNINACSGGNSGGGLVHSQEGDSGDRFSDSLTNLGFPEDTSDEVIHPDILKDLIDDVFTNPGDLVNGFNFVDNIVNVKEEENSQNAEDTMMGMGKILPNASTPQSPFPPAAAPPVISFSGTQTQQTTSPTGVFDFPSTGMAATTSPGLPTTGYPTNPRMSSYPTSTNLSMGSSLGLDFKLTEPSPAAQTLKQMAEQHQNMQQKQQQQIGLGLSSPHPRSPFGADPFPDSMTMRPNYLNGSMHKGSSNMFNPVGFAQQPGYGAVPPSGGITVKQEAGASMYGNMAPSGHIPEVELHKRRQQALHMQQQQQQQIPRVKPEQNPTNIGPRFEQKPVGSAPGVTYGSTRPLSHFSDPVGGTRTTNQSPVSLSNEYIRGVPGPEVTPPPPFATQGVNPATANVHLSQSQQMQISQNNQQLQVSQDQKFMVGQDMKQQTTVSSSQQQNVYASYGPPHSTAPTPGSFQMSQSQSVSFGVQYGANRTAAAPNMADPVTRQQLIKQQGGMSVAAQRQAQMQHYMARPPPPEYSRQTSLEGQLAGQQQLISGGEGGIMGGAQSQRYSPVSAQRRTMGRGYQENPSGQLTTGHPSPQNPTPPLINTPTSTPDLNSDAVPSQLMMPAYNPAGAPPSGPPQQQGVRPNMVAGLNKPVYTSALPRMQKPPPNASMSREGLCMNPRAPGMPGDWRQAYLHPHQQIPVPRSRMPYPRAMQQTTYGTTSPSGGMSMDASNPMLLQNHSRPMNEMSRMQLPPVANNQMMLQQQQMVVGQGGGHPNSPSAGQTVTMQMAASVSMTTPAGSHHQVYPQAEQTNVAPPVVQDSNQFSFDFLDTLDCSASDLLNFDQVMQGDGSGAGFALLEEIGMLGK